MKHDWDLEVTPTVCVNCGVRAYESFSEECSAMTREESSSFTAAEIRRLEQRVRELEGLLGEACHLWDDDYISYNQNSAAPHSIADETFAKISSVMDSTGRYHPYIGLTPPSPAPAAPIVFNTPFGTVVADGRVAPGEIRLNTYDGPVLMSGLAVPAPAVEGELPAIEVCGNNRHGWKARMTCVLPKGHDGNHEDSTRCWWR